MRNAKVGFTGVILLAVAVIRELAPINIDRDTVVGVVNRDLGPLSAAAGLNLEMANAWRWCRWKRIPRAWRLTKPLLDVGLRSDKCEAERPCECAALGGNAEPLSRSRERCETTPGKSAING